MPTIKYTPRFPGAIQGHAVNTVRKFFPKLSAEHEFDDLMQEAYIIFMRCKSRYGATVDNPAWFMSLFSRSLHNKLINMAEVSGRYISLELLEAKDEPASELDEGYLRRVLQELPSRVRRQVGIFLNGSETESREAYRRLRKLYPNVV